MMGYDIQEIARVQVRISRHNSEQAKIDNALAAEMADEIYKVQRQPKYNSISLAGGWEE